MAQSASHGNWWTWPKPQLVAEAAREGENAPKLDQVDQDDIEATREGETLPKLDQVD
jgi:hypothetical protein